MRAHRRQKRRGRSVTLCRRPERAVPETSRARASVIWGAKPRRRMPFRQQGWLSGDTRANWHVKAVVSRWRARCEQSSPCCCSRRSSTCQGGSVVCRGCKSGMPWVWCAPAEAATTGRRGMERWAAAARDTGSEDADKTGSTRNAATATAPAATAACPAAVATKAARRDTTATNVSSAKETASAASVAATSAVKAARALARSERTGGEAPVPQGRRVPCDPRRTS